MGNFSTRIQDCDSQSPAHLDFLLSCETSICFTMAFPLLGNSDHVFVSVSIDFPSKSKRDAPFYGIAYDCSCADWGGLRDHLTEAPWENIFKLIDSVAASEFFEFVQVAIEVYTLHCKYQVKPHSSPHSISCLCCLHTT